MTAPTGRRAVPETRPRRARDPKRRQRLVSGAVVGVLGAGLVLAGVLYDGVATADVDLNDGGVWVTSQEHARLARLNSQVHLLDGGLAARSADVDVLQEAGTVFLVDEGAGVLQQVDPAAVAATTTVSLAGPRQIELGGGTLAVLDSRSGQLHTTAATAAGALADEERKAATGLGANAVIAVGVDGTTYGVSPGDATLVAVPAGFDPEGEEEPEVAELGVDPARLEDAEIQVSAVGDQPVVVVRDEQDRATLLRPETEPVDLTGIADTAQVALQAPSAAARDVVVAARDGLVRVPLGRGEPTVEEVSEPGTPSEPVVVAGCTHGAWAGGGGTYLALCGGGEAVEQPIDKALGDSRLVFRVNRDVVVLNDLVAGTVWLVQDAMEIVENWDDVIPPQESSEDEEESQQEIQEQLPLDRDQENRPPIAQDDELGVRAGSTTVLEVLANDTDPDGDLLTVADFETPGEGFGTVRPIMGGRALQIDVAEGASGAVALGYTVSDGRGGQDEATARVTVAPESTNRPPEQLRPVTLTLVSGATGSVNVLDSVQDPDGDELVVVSATPTTDDTVRFTPDGAVTFVDSGVSPGVKPVVVEVSDGRDVAEVELTVDVRPPGALPPVPVFDFVTAIAGEETVVEPLLNDTDPGGEAEPLRLADVQQLPDATVVPDYDAGTFRFSSDSAGTSYLTYIVVNDAGASATGLIRIDVREPGDAAPVAVQDVALLPAGGQVLVDVLANDEDPSGELLAVRQVDVDPETGLSVAVLDHRILKISATQDIQTPQRLTYEVSNGSAGATGEVVVMPIPPDSLAQPPVAQADVANVRAGDFVTIPVLSNDSHPGGDEFELVGELVEEPQAGHLFASGDTLRFRAPEQPQTVNAVYEIVDSTGQRASAQVTIYVQADDGERNAAPLPLPVESRAFAGERVRIQVPLFGIDPDGDSVQLLGADQAPTKGRVVEVGPTYIDYEAFSRASGTDTFTYAVRDRMGAYASAPVRVAVVPPPEVNRAPQAVDDEITVRPGRAVDVDPLLNDTDPDGDPLYLGDPAFDEVEDLEVEQLDSGRLRVTTPEQEGSFALPYHVSDQRGGTSTGIITVHVSAEAELLAPVAVDDLVRAVTILGQERVSVPVLDNDSDPDGTREGLSVDLVGSPAHAVVEGDEVVVDVQPSRQVLTYSVTDQDGLTAYAFVDVPGLEDSGPVLRTDAEPIVVSTGETREIELADYVIAPSGKDVRLTDTEKVRATNSDGSSPVVGPTTLTFTSAPTYAGPATLTFEVTDGESAQDPEGLTAVLTLDITVESTENTPPTFDGAAVEVVPAEGPVELNLRRLSQDPDTGDYNQLSFDLVEVPEGIDAALDGPNLTVSAPVDTPRGTTGDIRITVSDAKAEPVPGVVEVTVTASNRRLATVNDVDLGELEQGDSETVDVLRGAFNPFPDEPLRVVGAVSETGGPQPTADDTSVTVTAGEDFVGRASTRFTVNDATGDPLRHVEGRITYSVIGVPERPAPPRVEEVRDRTVVLTWTAPADNGAPITGYRVEAAGVSQECPTTTCTIGGLTNDVEYTFTVTAVNKVGDSEPSGPSAVARPDVKPERPAAPTLAFGDGELEVEWATPESRGSAVTSYDLQIAPSPGGGQISVSGNSHTWTGLQNGQSYTVRVRAHNDAPDPSEWSEWSAPEVPAGKPDRPVAPVAERVDSPVNAQITASWTAPPNNGDTISAYDVVIRRDGAAFKSFTLPGGQTSFTEDAPAGSDYTVTVAATNKAGTSETSPPSAPVRSFLAPDRVPSISARETGADGQVELEYGTPAANGDPIRRYEVRTNGGSWSQAPANGIMTGLSNGSSYRFEVRACNTYCGDPSAASNAVVPYGPFGQATMSGQRHGRHNEYIDTITEQPGATFSWTTPAGNGRDVTSVQLRIDNGSGSWGQWQNVPATGNRKIDGDWGTTYRAQIRAQRADGQERTANASVTTIDAPVRRPPPPPDPSIRIVHTRSAVGQEGCSHSSCRFLDFTYEDLPSGRYTIQAYGTHHVTGVFGPFGTPQRNIQLSGSGTHRGWSYYGNPGGDVELVITGPETVRHRITWPSNP